MSEVDEKIAPSRSSSRRLCLGKRQIAVVTNGDLAVLAGDRKRLDLLDRVLAGGRVSRVPDRARAGQVFEHIFVQHVGDQADSSETGADLRRRRNNAAGLLPAMLERKKPKLRQRRGFRVAENAKNAAFFVKFVENNIHLILFCHRTILLNAETPSVVSEIVSGVFMFRKKVLSSQEDR